jgi:hypothetical protein
MRVEVIKRNPFKLLNVPESKRSYYGSYDDDKQLKLFSNSQLVSPTAWVGHNTGNDNIKITVDVDDLNYNGIIFKERYDTYFNVHRVTEFKLEEKDKNDEIGVSMVTLKWKNGEAFHPLKSGMKEITIIPKQWSGMFPSIRFDLVKYAGCFSSSMTLQTLKGTQNIMDTKVGDEIYNGVVYERITHIMHKSYEPIKTLMIYTNKGHIELTHDHLVRVMQSFERADSLYIGQYIDHDEIIQSIKETISEGVCAPLTPSGTILVNGIRCSCYVEYEMMSHQLMHIFMKSFAKRPLYVEHEGLHPVIELMI